MIKYIAILFFLASSCWAIGPIAVDIQWDAFRSPVSTNIYTIEGKKLTYTGTTAYSLLGKSILLNGNDDKLDAKIRTIVNTGNMTIFGVFRLDSWGGNNNGRIIDSGSFAFYVDTAGDKLVLTSNSFANKASSATNSLVLGNTYVVAVTRAVDGTTNFYINGELSGTADQSSGTPSAISADCNLWNRDSAPGRGMGGLGYHVAVNYEVLSLSQIRHQSNELTKMYKAGN